MLIQQWLMYVIQLSNNKWFIYVGESFLEASIFIECKSLYEFVRENEPIRIQKTKIINNLMKVDYFVKKYMMKYGIDNVRGGTYSKLQLEDHLQCSLIAELSFPCQNTITMDIVNRTNEKYFNFIWSVENVQTEIERLRHELAIYSDVENTLSRLQYHKVKNIVSNETEYVFFDDVIFTELEWLQKNIDDTHKDVMFKQLEKSIQNIKMKELAMTDSLGIQIQSDLQWITDWMKRENILEKRDTKSKYQEIMYRFSGIYETFKHIQETSYDYPLKYKPILYLQRPDACLDAIFCHSHPLECHFSVSKDLLSHIEYMANVITNRIHETQFTLNQYSTSFRQEIDYAIQYLTAFSM
jgi:hypothetical protein